jgi:probable O-glycosylation ligase (exosortase A-associated)
VPIGISVLAAVNPELCVFGYSKYIKMVVALLCIPWLIYNELWLRRLVLTISFALGLIALKFTLFAVKAGGSIQFNKGHAGFMSDNNGLALAMAMLVPICWHARKLAREKWVKTALLVCTASAFATVILSFSRGGAVALAAVLAMLVWRSKYKVVGLFGVAILMVPALLLVGANYADRLSTLGDVSSEASAFSRIVLAKAALAMWRDFPLFGVGFGEDNWVALSSHYLGEENVRKVHNTYLQMLVDSGIFAFLMHCLLIWGTAIWLGSTAKATKKLRPGWEEYPYMFQVSIITFGVGSTFYSRPDYELFYIVLLTAGVWYTVYKTEVLPQRVEIPRGVSASSVSPPKPSLDSPPKVPSYNPNQQNPFPTRIRADR